MTGSDSREEIQKRGDKMKGIYFMKKREKICDSGKDKNKLVILGRTSNITQY